MISDIKKTICEKYCFLFLLIILTVSVSVDNGKLVTNIYRVLICLPILICIRWSDIKSLLTNKFVQLFFALTLWSTVTLLWPDAEKQLNMFTKILTTVVFIYLLHLCFIYQKEKTNNVDTYYIMAAVLLSIIILLKNGHNLYFAQPVFGAFGNINEVAWFLASAFLLACYKIIYNQHRIINLLALVIITYVLFLTQSLGAYLAITTGLAVFLLSSLKPIHQRQVFFILGFCVAIFICLHFLFPGYFLDIYNNLDEARVHIYLNSFKFITSSYWDLLFGSGLTADANNVVGSIVMNHWHSIYISMVFYCGVVGLLLLLACLLYRFYQIFTHKTCITSWDLAVAGMMVAMLFDGNRIYNYPGGFFMAFSIPWFISNLHYIHKEKRTSI